MTIAIQESAQQIWLTHYHLSLQATRTTRTAYLLCLADNAKHYHEQIQQYLNQNQLSGQAQLAPLPIQTWLTRHGFEAMLWRAAQQLSPSLPLLCLYIDEEQTQESLRDYLQQQSIHFTPFTTLSVKEALPVEVRSFFFADFEGLGEYHQILNQAEHKNKKEKAKSNKTEKHLKNSPHFYAVVDCAKAVSFPSRLESAGRMANLYIGNTGQALEEQAPHLLEFDPYQAETVAFLQRLFRQSDSKVFSHWAINPVIFIKSEKSFDEIYHHLRKWTHLKNPENGEWYFFRFYDPLVLNRYLPQLARYPAQLSALFGVKTNSQTKQQEQIIDAFGLRVDDEFIQFSLNPLPENTQPAKIELGKIEQHAMETMVINKFKQQLINLFEQNHPIRFRSLKTEHKNAFVNHIYYAALAHQLVRQKEIAFFGHLMLYFGAHWYEDPIYHFITQYLKNDEETIDRRMEHITHMFNQSMPIILGENLENSVHIIKALLTWYMQQSKETISPNLVVNKITQITKPYFSNYVNEKHVLVHIRQSLENAKKHFGVQSDYQQGSWILLSLLLGIGFYQDPLIPWANEILMTNNTLDEKVDALLEMLQKRANKMLINVQENHLDV